MSLFQVSFHRIALIILLVGNAVQMQTQPVNAGPAKRWDFDRETVGELPPGWQTGATNQRGPLATWEIVADSSAPSGSQVLALTQTNHSFGGTFNLCWNPKARFLNGRITVAFKANSGLEDQGGGIIWRVRDGDNYYIARYNPLENNFRIYYVRDGARRMLASARIVLPAHVWQVMKIVQDGNHIEGFLNGEKYLEIQDETFPNPGGTGLWTKADAVTSFDNFFVETLP